MAFAILSFSVVFLLIASGGLILFYREAMLQRISDVINPQAKKKTLMGAIQETGLSIGGVVEHFENVLPKSQAEVSVVLQRLNRAGFRNESAVKIFYGSKVLIPLLLCAVALLSGIGNKSPLFVYTSCLGLGFLAPDFWLGRKIKKRQSKIRRGLPDVLDLLIICIEAGLSLDQGTARTSVELVKAQPELCDELSIVVLEQRAGRPRADAWKHMAERTGVDAVRNLVSMLVQSEQLGTSIGKTLRTHSDTLRLQRVQAVEEAAAKLTIKLLFPLVIFIFPSLFLVVLGPAMISMADNFKTLFSSH
jgi:tight adherence protein C